eukprot:TRINITY_DN13550_c0_g1_i1.p1 TRINITY_DN13550_c0_g1~~TRINITY_DN13550_c0_g1_i1.p1  ORF type:complete len:283 (-),score=40.56 TRINITY_DN13550_c0_g1_i1:36-884(-)
MIKISPHLKDIRTIQDVISYIKQGKNTVITGAGISTRSGLKDYRGPDGRYRKKGFNPINIKDFMATDYNRKRYWARSMFAWEGFMGKVPNEIHHGIADLEKQGVIKHVITQNVDRLHHKAGSNQILELHGSLYQVMCLSCREKRSRNIFQIELDSMNPQLRRMAIEVGTNPDGDVELDYDYEEFNLPGCKSCGGILKPDVVLFGETIQKDVVDRSKEMVLEGDKLIVLGSSLTVFSAYRLIKLAESNNIPIIIVNKGYTRGDDLAAIKLDMDLKEFFDIFKQ